MAEGRIQRLGLRSDNLVSHCIKSTVQQAFLLSMMKILRTTLLEHLVE